MTIQDNVFVLIPIPEGFDMPKRPTLPNGAPGTISMEEMLRMGEFAAHTIARHISGPFKFEARMVMDKIQGVIHFPYGLTDEDYVMLKLAFDGKHVAMGFPWKAENVVHYMC